MTNASITGTSAETQTPSLAAQFLASLNGNLSSRASLNAVFDNILSDIHALKVEQAQQPQQSQQLQLPQTQPPTKVQPIASKVTNDSSVSYNPPSQPAQTPTAPVQVTSNIQANKSSGFGWSNKSQSRNSKDNQSSSSDSDTGAAAASTTASTPPTQSQPQVQYSNQTGDNAATSGETTKSSVDATPQTDSGSQTGNEDKSLTDMIAQLQALLQTVRKAVQSEQESSGGPVANSGLNGASQALPQTNLSDQVNNQQNVSPSGANTPNAANQTDPSLQQFDQALAELLQLARDVLKNSGALPDVTTAKDGGQTTQATSAQNLLSSLSASPDAQQPADTPTQFLADMKSLFDNLKTALSAANKNAPMDAVLNPAPVNVSQALPDLSQSPTTVSTLLTDNTGNVPSVKSADPLSQLNNFFASAVNANFSPVVPASTSASASDPSAVTLVASKEGTFPDFANSNSDADSFLNGSSGNAGNLNSITGASVSADGTKGLSSYGFASQLASLHNPNSSAATLPTAVEQVMFQLSRNVKAGNDQMTLQLHPEELGKINIKLSISDDGSVRGTVTANNPATLDMLQKDAKNLERVLQDAGLHADAGSLNFSLGGQGNRGSSQTANQGASGGGTADNLGGSGDAASLPEDETAQNWVLTPGRVNVTV